MNSARTPVPPAKTPVLNYWEGRRLIWQDTTGFMETPPVVDTGVILDNVNWRVVDVWCSYDHHGQLDEGWHVFLEPAADAENRPKELWPEYFT